MVAKKLQSKYRTAQEWKALGVKVQRTTGDLPRTERETSVNFIDSETEAEINTCRSDWMRHLERHGAKPQSIQIYDEGEGEYRWYIVPKTWVKRPSKPSEARKAAGRQRAAKNFQN